MSKKVAISSLWVAVWLITGLAVTVALGSPEPVGLLMVSKNATLDGQPPLSYTTLLSGDRLQVADGVAMLTVEQQNHLMLGKDTDASLSRGENGVTVSLSHGIVALEHPQASETFQVKVGDVTVTPSKGFRSLGEIASTDGLLMVSAKNGALQVEHDGSMSEVAEGKTITIPTAAGASTPYPQGNRHLKHIWRMSPEMLLILGLAAEAAGLAIAIYYGTRSPAPVSIVAPGPRG